MSDFWMRLILFGLGLIAGAVVTATIFMVEMPDEEDEEDE